MYYKYTGKVFLNFNYFIKSSTAKFLPFWSPKEKNDKNDDNHDNHDEKI